MSTFVPETHIQQVLQAVDIVDVIGNYLALKPKGKEMVGLCPFHEDSRPSFNVSKSKQIFKCFACGAGGNAINFLMRREHLSFPEAVAILSERAGLEMPRETTRPTDAAGGDRRVLENVNRWAAKFFRQQLEDPDVGAKARAYVEERRLSEQTSRRFGLGYAPEGWDTLKNAAQQAGIAPIELVRVGLLVAKEDGHHYDRFRDRLIFPVIDAVGRIIGFGGRTLSEDPAKYLNSPESVLFDKSRALYGIHAAKDPIVKQRTAVVVEGYTDCLMAHQFEVANVVATLGTALTAEHAHMLSRYADRVIVVFDSDEAGRKAADRAINIFFAQKVEVRLVSLPEGQDPCDYLDAHGTDAFVELLGTAVEALEYKWRGLQKQLDQTGTIEGKRRITEEFLSVIAHAHHQGNMDTISEGFLVNHVAKLIGAFPQEVHHTLARLKRQSGPRARVENAASETGATTPNEPIARNGYEKAQQVVLETLLNYPDCFERVENVMADPDEFSPGILRRIAGLIWDAHERYGQATITNILATVHDLQLSNILTDMVERGASRGEFDNTLDGALAALAQARNEQERQRVRQAVTTAAVDYGDDAEAAMLLEIQAKYGPNLRRPGAR